jgi:hypothetical protein
MAYVNTITPQRILGYIEDLKNDMVHLERGDCSGVYAVNLLRYRIDQIEFQARYMVEDAYREAVEDRDIDTLKRIFQFNPEYRLLSSIAITKIMFEGEKP